MRTSVPKPPEILDKIVDVVLAHSAKAKDQGRERAEESGEEEQGQLITSASEGAI